MAKKRLPKVPNRFLFIASLGNPGAYHFTRHSAGHVLLDALLPHLPSRLSLEPPAPRPKDAPPPTASELSSSTFYQAWHSPSLMNATGPKLVRQLKKWADATREDILRAGTTSTASTANSSKMEDLSQVKGFNPTLVLLHDELEQPLGNVRVRWGGAEEASLRGHRGLGSTMESLRKYKIYPRPAAAAAAAGDGSTMALSIMRIGVGIGRPATRERADVARYVLEEMEEKELDAVRGTARFVVKLLAEELYREPPVQKID